MSTKRSILLTSDGEHWYNDCSEPLTGLNEKPYKDAITLEFSKENIRIDSDDEWCLAITITNPNCQIYKLISKLRELPNEFKSIIEIER
jgi:hypothetical protein